MIELKQYSIFYMFLQ